MDVEKRAPQLKTLPQGELKKVNLAEERFQSMISEVEDYAILLLDLEGKIITWNKGAEKLKGYTAAEIVGKSYKLFYPQEDVARGLPDVLLDEAREKGKVNHEGWRVKKNGYRFWGNVTITALHDSIGNLTGFLKVTRDLTDRKIESDRYNNMLEELRMQNEELKKEEMRYHKMVSEVQDYAIILLDVEGKILDWNKGAERVKGYSNEEIIGKNFKLFYSQEDREADLPQKLLNEAATQGFVTHEGYRIRRDGTRFWGNVAITALHDDDGQIIGFSKVTKDLTERKAAEDRLAIFTHELKMANDQLRISEERYHKMISEVQDYAILLLDVKGNVQNWNTGAELIKGYKSNDIIGKNFSLFYLPDDVAKGLPEKLLLEARANGRATSEGWRKRKDGTKFWASVVITALHNNHGDIIGYSKVTRDLTERKRADDALKEKSLQLELKNHELEQLNAELSSFAYVVSHDLKEPIRKIQIYASRQLEADKSPDEMRMFAEKIISSSERMRNLMDSLLSYSRVSNDNVVVGSVDLNEILEEVKIDLEILLAESNAVINSDKLPVIRGIAFQLHQLFLNLITNSVKFAHAERIPTINIQCELCADKDLPEELIIKNRRFYCLTFTDNGIGFEPSQKEKIFDVFRKLSPKDARGTGIGLAIVKKVVHNHHGHVVAHGVSGKGASFSVFLPERIIEREKK